MILENVHEYTDGYPVEFEIRDGRECVIATNECGYNQTVVDAWELYLALKEYYSQRSE